MKKTSVKIIGFILFIATLVAVFSVQGFASDGEKDHTGEDLRLASRFYELLFKKKEETLLYPGGFPIGILIDEGTVTVTAPSFDKKLIVGDKVLKINGNSVSVAEEVEKAICESGGAACQFEIQRGEKVLNISIIPKEADGEFSVGAVFRSRTAGIGTVTFLKKDGGFGALGHGVCTSEGAAPISLKSATALAVTLGGINRGECGKAGELCGILKREKLGVITTNCECGVFGRLKSLPKNEDIKPMPIGKRDGLKEGDAKIIATVKNGLTASYSIRISDIDVDSTGSKSFKIKVTDETLISLTGGIVRGMSGSPIIQDGKLVGAVTHVMVADPTEGYGIFIENMLSAANEGALPKVA